MRRASPAAKRGSRFTIKLPFWGSYLESEGLLVASTVRGSPCTTITTSTGSSIGSILRWSASLVAGWVVGAFAIPPPPPKPEYRSHWVFFAGSAGRDRKSTRLNSSHEWISYAVFCLKKKKHL